MRQTVIPFCSFPPSCPVHVTSATAHYETMRILRYQMKNIAMEIIYMIFVMKCLSRCSECHKYTWVYVVDALKQNGRRRGKKCQTKRFDKEKLPAIFDDTSTEIPSK